MTLRALKCTAILGVCMLGAADSAIADRLVLSPRGLVARPFSIGAEYAVHPYSPRREIGWLTIGMPQEDLGLELEVERFEVADNARETFGLQYTFTGNGVADFAPALSVGIRDVLRRGREDQALFAAVTKNIGVPLSAERYVGNLKVHAGYGTSGLGGLFVGTEARIYGVWLGVELLARRLNASAAVPVLPNLMLRAYTLNGSGFFGASYSVRR